MESQKTSSNGQNAEGQTSPIRAALEALPPDAPQILAYGAFFEAGHDTGAHHHARAQFVHAESGLLRVRTADGQWLVPPGMAVWVPAGVSHRVEAVQAADFVSLYLRPAAPGERVIPIPETCTVVAVPPLLRQLIVKLAAIGAEVVQARAGRLGAVIADELEDLRPTDLHLPVPSDRRAAYVALALIRDPSDGRALDQWGRAAGASSKTLTRHFLAETGLSFVQWRQRCRLLAAVEMLSAGHSVTDTALNSGYRSPSAFSAAFLKVVGVAPKACSAAKADMFSVDDRVEAEFASGGVVHPCSNG